MMMAASPWQWCMPAVALVGTRELDVCNVGVGGSGEFGPFEALVGAVVDEKRSSC